MHVALLSKDFLFGSVFGLGALHTAASIQDFRVVGVDLLSVS